MRYAHALATGATPAATTPRCSGTRAPSPALGVPFDRGSAPAGPHAVRRRAEAARAGGAAPRPTRCCCSTSRTTTSTSPGKRWLEQRAQDAARRSCSSATTASCWPTRPTRSSPSRRTGAWVHGGGFATYHERGRRGSSGSTSCTGAGTRSTSGSRSWSARCSGRRRSAPTWPRRYRAMQTRLEKYEAAGPPPERPRSRRSDAPRRRPHRRPRARLRRGLELDRADRSRSTPRSSSASASACSARTAPASRTSCGCSPASAVAHTGGARLGARVVPGLLRADARRPDARRTRRWSRCSGAATGARPAAKAMRRAASLRAARRRRTRRSTRCPAGSRRGSRSCCSSCRGATMLLLDEPTDNLDLASAEALEEALAAFEGTVLAVTHDRWFMRVVRPVPRLRRGRSGVRGAGAVLARYRVAHGIAAARRRRGRGDDGGRRRAARRRGAAGHAQRSSSRPTRRRRSAGSSGGRSPRRCGWVLGDSTALGVGVTRVDDTVGGQLARCSPTPGRCVDARPARRRRLPLAPTWPPRWPGRCSATGRTSRSS